MDYTSDTFRQETMRKDFLPESSSVIAFNTNNIWSIYIKFFAFSLFLKKEKKTYSIKFYFEFK
jgi:hypothetical protein